MSVIKVKDKKITLDSSQIKAFNELNILNNILKNQKKTSFFSKLFSKKNQQIDYQGIYLYGRVGRGKSMLMKNFFNNFEEEKLYLHFNAFMQKIHRILYKIRNDKSQNKDELIEIATKEIVNNAKLICLDEFQVDDVTDALILRRIFSYIFKQNIIVIFTSNSKPENLYQNGLQRELFLKFINNILKESCKIINLDSEIDYREKFLNKVKQHYFYPINKENNNKILNIFSHLTHKNKPYKDKITILKRDLIINKSYENIVIFDFKELCQENIGVIDYQAICKKYDIIFLLNVPKLTKDERNEAKRFILFIDEIYENKKILLILCDVKIEDIYQEGKDSKKFKRTISRLKEIMSDEYITTYHK